jgi:hypothetical protein
VTDNAQLDGSGSNDLDQVQEYRRLMLDYEGLDEQVDALLAQYNGATENMPDEEYERYRELARRRDGVYHQMKALEGQLFPDDDNS